MSRESSPILPGHLTELTCIAKGRVPNLSLVIFAGFVAAIEKYIIENDIVQPSSFREDIPLDLVQLALIISSSIAASLHVYAGMCNPLSFPVSGSPPAYRPSSIVLSSC